MVGLGVFVFLPLALYLLLGLIFVIGFMALVKICQQLRDTAKSRILARLIARIAVYSTLSILPNAVLLPLHLRTKIISTVKVT